MTNRLKVLTIAFNQFLYQLLKDAMLILLCSAPVLCGLFFLFGIPFAQSLLIKYLDKPDLLPPYYLLFDLMLATLTPMLYCFAAAYVILGEIDDGLSKYLAVTPIGKRGYLISRLGFPAIIAFIISIIAVSIFKLTAMSIGTIILVTFMASILGIVEALLVVSLSGNKVEGMAVSKLSGLFMLGMVVPFFIKGSIQYIIFFLPSFWIAKYLMDGNLIYAFIGILTSGVWGFILYRKFITKIS